MTRDDIIAMAHEAGFVELRAGGYIAGTARLERFAQLVAAAEREACAKVCEAGINNSTDWDSSVWNQACENRAYAIRARGQQ